MPGGGMPGGGMPGGGMPGGNGLFWLECVIH